MLGRSLTLFEIFGVKVKVNLGWAIIALFIAWSLAQGVFPELYEGLVPSAYGWMAVAAVLGLAASIVLHELAHSLVARAFGIPLSGITLFALGGVAEIEKEPPSPTAEFLMAIAGPAVSLLIAAALGGLGAAVEGLQAPALSGVLDYLSLLNVVLAVFNMIPAFPLDGGRAVRAAVWAVKKDYRVATHLAARLGSAFGVVLIIGGVLLALTGAFANGLWWILIGLFLRGAAEGADFEEEASSQLKGRSVRDVMTVDPDVVRPETPLDSFVEDHLYPLHHDLFPVVRNDGQPVGVIGLKQLKRVPRGVWNSVAVGEAAAPVTGDLVIDASADAFEAVKRMQRAGRSRLLVLEQGRLVGMLSLKDLLELIAIRLQLAPA